MQSQHSNLMDEFDPSEEDKTQDNFEKEESDQYGRNRAHHAALEEDLNLLQELIEMEGDEVLVTVDDNGWTPLHEAARTLNIEIVQYMIEHGADAHLRNVENETALDVATYFGGENHAVTLYLKGLMDSVVDSHDEL